MNIAPGTCLNKIDSICRVKQKATPKGHGLMLEEACPDHAINSIVVIVRLPHPD